MLHLYAIGIHGVAQQYELGLFLVLSDSTPDSSTARWPIPILSMGQCSAASQLSNGVRYVSTRLISMGFPSVMRVVSILVLLDSMPDSSTTRQPIPILSTGKCSAPSQLSNAVSYILMRHVFMELPPVMEVWFKGTSSRGQELGASVYNYMY